MAAVVSGPVVEAEVRPAAGAAVGAVPRLCPAKAVGWQVGCK